MKDLDSLEDDAEAYDEDTDSVEEVPLDAATQKHEQMLQARRRAK